MRPIPYTSYGDGFLKWINKQQYTYNVIVDTDLDGFSNLKGKILVIIGHSEYWTRKGRRNFDRFVDGGGDALVLSGNTMWWQVRYSEDQHQLICYKGLDEPPVVDSLKTIEWTKGVLKYSIVQSIGCDFDRGGYGAGVKNDGWKGFKVVTPGSPLLAGLTIRKGEVISCPSTEYDGAPLKGFAPDGTPRINNDDLKFENVQLIGYDFGARNNIKTVPTAIIFRKTVSSGVVIDFPTTNWCTVASFNEKPIVDITKNAIDGLLARRNLFAD